MNIIVTGAGKGIGFEIVKIFARSKAHNIFAIIRNTEDESKLQEIFHTGDSGIIPFYLDITDAGGIENLKYEIIKRKLKIDILINNAGLMIKKPFNELDDNDFDVLFGTNVKAPFRLTRSLLPVFNDKAHIVNVSSMGGYQGSRKFSGLSLYSASKGALAILTECLAEEMKSMNISVNCLCLGSVDTGMFKKTFPGLPASVSSEDMAVFIADFALNGSKFFNGKIIPVSVSTP